MAHILLAHSNHIYSDKKQASKMQPYPPLQTLLAAAALEQAGHSVALFDSTFDASPERFRNALAQHRPDKVIVCEDDFNFLTKMCLTQNRALACSLAEMAQEAGTAAFAHGSDATDRTAAYLAAGFSAVLIGDVEETVVALSSGLEVEKIPGLAYLCPQGVHYTAPRPSQMNLDRVPSPAWHLIDADAYREAWCGVHGSWSLNLVTSRGCPYRCNWCAKPVFGSQYRVHSAERAAQDLARVKHLFDPQHIWFADDIFALSPRWTREFADAVARLDARIPFKMQSRCDLMTRDTVAALREAGCYEVWMGAESGSQRVLDAMDKDVRVDQIRVARENLRAHGIRACYFLQFGYPGECWEDIQATIRMVRETAPDDIGVSVSYPLPGTKFHQIVSSQIADKSNWTDSADLAMMFRGEFSTEFYRALADALHAEVRGTAGAATAWESVQRLREDHMAAVA